MLRECLKQNLKLVKVHRVLYFKQSPFLKSYIEFNAQKRKQAKNRFEQDFYKLMSNSVFGKTIESVRNRANIRLVHRENQLLKLVNKSSYKRTEILNENLVAVESMKTCVFLNKPIYVGQAILDISKQIMNDFHYNFIKKVYGDKCSLLFTDTDSLCYEIRGGDDIYSVIGKHSNLFDLSNYPVSHELYSSINCKVPGKFKDEMGGVCIKQFIGIRSKMYSFVYGEDSEKRTAKGICKSTILKDLNHDLYRKCLLESTSTYNDMNLIGTVDHTLHIIRKVKKGLCAFDNKRFILPDGIHTLPYGHYSTLE